MSSEGNKPLIECFYRKSWALIIGIDNYPHLPVQFQLNYAVADAVSVADLLKSRFGFEDRNVKILRDAQATKQNILNAISDFVDPNYVNENDCLLFFFSGHGQTVSLPESGGGGEIGFLVPYDAQVDISGHTNMAQYDRYCIPMEELIKKAKLIPAKHIIFIMDACYSGLVLESYRGLDSKTVNYLEKVASVPVRQIITAGRKGELSVELPDLGHGLFTYKLVEGLEKNLADINGDGVITGVELSGYLSSVVPAASSNNQIPQFGKRGEGDFIFSPRLGLLQIQVDPPDANVTVTSIGEPRRSFLASSSKMELPFGTYSAIAERDGYETASVEKIVIADMKAIPLTLALKPKTASITGQSLPEGTKVFVDDISVTLPYQIMPGTHKIRLQRDGFKTHEMIEILTPGQLFPLNSPWENNFGRIQLKITPADAKVLATSLTTLEAFNLLSTIENNLPVGIYSVTVEKDGYETITDHRVEVVAGQMNYMTLTLRPKLAVISDQFLPENTRVFVDGSAIRLPHQLTPGVYKIRLERDSFKPHETTETLKPSQVLSLNPVWVPLSGIMRLQITPKDAEVKLTPSGLSKGFSLPPTGEVPVGTYDITVKRKGYHTIIRENMGIRSDMVTSLTLNLIPKSRWKASAQSIVWPGWGDLPDRKIAGILMSIVQISTIAGAVICHLDYNDKLNEYSESLRKLNNPDSFSSLTEYDAYYQELRLKRDDALMTGRLRDTFFYSAVIGVRLLGAIETSVFMPRPRSEGP